MEEYKISPLYYLTILSGPIVIWAITSAECLIPARNVLKEPEYWYEYQLLMVLGLVPLFLGQTFINALYWCNFSFDNKWISYSVIIGTGVVVHLATLFIYEFTWTSYFGYVHPMPVNFYVTTFYSYNAVMLATGYRYYIFYVKLLKRPYSKYH